MTSGFFVYMADHKHGVSLVMKLKDADKWFLISFLNSHL